MSTINHRLGKYEIVRGESCLIDVIICVALLRVLVHCVLIVFVKPNLDLEVGILQITVITAGTDILDATC